MFIQHVPHRFQEKSVGRNTLNLMQEFKNYTQKKSCQKAQNRKTSKDIRKPSSMNIWDLTINQPETSDKNPKAHPSRVSPFCMTYQEVFWWSQSYCILKQEFWDPYAPSINMSSLWGEDEQALKAKQHSLNQEQAAAAGRIEPCQSENQGVFFQKSC